MSKKVWLVLLAVVLVFGLSVIGCGGGDDGGGDGVVRSVDLLDNFEYGYGYQGKIVWTDKDLPGSADKIEVDDEYELEIAFTVSRDLEDKLMWCIADTSPEAKYWKELGVDAWRTVFNGEYDEDTEVPKFKTTDKVSYKGTYKIAFLPAATIDKVNLVFQADGEGTHEIANSGKKGKVTLNFTTFKFTKVKK